VFTSIETSDLTSALRVENDGILTPFSRDRLFVSIYESCRHRPTAVRDAGNLTAQVIHDLIDHQAQAGLLQRVQIVTATQRVLQTFDAAAAAVYTAYHPA
jgi:transcriptional regulator NrdR family protein